MQRRRYQLRQRCRRPSHRCGGNIDRITDFEPTSASHDLIALSHVTFRALANGPLGAKYHLHDGTDRQPQAAIGKDMAAQAIRLGQPQNSCTFCQLARAFDEGGSVAADAKITLYLIPK